MPSIERQCRLTCSKCCGNPCNPELCIMATYLVAGDITQVYHFVAEFHISMAVAICLLQDVHCIFFVHY